MLAMDEHMQTMSIEERKVVTEPTEDLEDIPLDENNPEKYKGLEQVWRRR